MNISELIKENKLDKLELYLRRGGNPNVVDDGLPLICSALIYNARALKLLLEYGADPNLIERDTGLTPLQLVVMYINGNKFIHSYDCAKVLLEYGANQYVYDGYGNMLIINVLERGKQFINIANLFLDRLNVKYIDFETAKKLLPYLCELGKYEKAIAVYKKFGIAPENCWPELDKRIRMDTFKHLQLGPRSSMTLESHKLLKDSLKDLENLPKYQVARNEGLIKNIEKFLFSKKNKKSRPKSKMFRRFRNKSLSAKKRIKIKSKL